MYVSLRCAGPRCRVSTRNAYRVTCATPYRAFHISHPRKAPSDPPGKRKEETGDNDGSRAKDRPTVSKWRRRQQLNARNDSYMIVDPTTGSAEILGGNGKSKRDKPKKLPAVQLPEWFDDCVTWPDATSEGGKKQVVFLPSRIQNITGMSFLSPSDLSALEKDAKGAEDKGADEEKPTIKGSQDKFNTLEDPSRIWLDPLLFTEMDGVVRTSLELPASERDTPLSLRSTVSIHSPLEGGMPLLNDIIEDIASRQGAGLLRLNAQDLAELGGSYVCPDAGLDVSLQTLPFDAYNDAVEETAVEEQDPAEEDEAAASEDEEARPKPPQPQFATVWMNPAFMPAKPGKGSGNILKQLLSGQFPGGQGSAASKPLKTNEKDEDEADTEPLLDEARVDKFLNAVIDGAWAKQTIPISEVASEGDNAKAKLVVCVEDLIRLTQTAIGIELVERLAEVIRIRRAEKGEKIALVGLSIDTDLLNSHEPEKTIQWETDHSIWRTFIVTPHAANGSVVTSKHADLQAVHAQRNAQINLRNWYVTASQMAPDLMPKREYLLKPEARGLGHAIGLSKAVLPRDEIQRLATSSIARVLTDKRDKVALDDLVRVMSDNNIIDQLRESRLQSLRASSKTGAFPFLTDPFANLFTSNTNSLGFGAGAQKSAIGTSEVAARLQDLQKEADRYEKKLINGVVLPEKINTTFSDVHVAKTTVEAVRDLTALSLQRPDAFKYGVLATNTLSGLLLYGPPGTGKTMLAKAVAKESEAAVLTVTGSDVNQMWVGESEKTVKAIFTLARKLAPCIVFIDEADALLASRGSDGRGGRPNHRDTINQFLLEWDGMNESGVFLMVATNRPFDLDDAVLRRLPRRVLVDLPTKEDREAILNIHLKGEQIADGVSIPDLAQRTPYYSGSDLKNVVVSAALSAVRDELDARKVFEAEHKTDDGATKEEYVFPEKRTLTEKHFEKAIGEVGASVSEDMSSLRAIRKFDEQYGERKGRRKRNPFGLGRVKEREEDARVRA